MTDTSSASGRFNLVVRYLIVGGLNTAIGYGLFALCNQLFASLRFGYLLATVVSNAIAITVAFLQQKHLVFRTQGSSVAEFLRYNAVIGVSFGLNLAMMPVLVEWCGISPLMSGALLLLVNIPLNFFGHAFFSFAGKSF